MATLGGYLNSTPSPPLLRTLADCCLERILIVTADSRILVGSLQAADNQTNLVRTQLASSSSPCRPSDRKLTSKQVLKDAVERIIREPDDHEASAEIPLGLYLVRGDNVCTVGLVDEKLDDSITWTEVKGSPIGGVKHI